MPSCVECSVREERLFCNLGPGAVSQLDSIRQLSVYPKGSLLFVQGQAPRGVFILCAGSVKLTITSARGRSLIVRVAEAGEVLGLGAAMSNQAYDVSAETLEPTEVNFLPREEFLGFLRKHGEVSVRVAQHLSLELQRAYQQVTRIALAPTARAKLAGLLVEWAAQHARPAGEGFTFPLRLTHEEIAELIGSSRETVTRLLNDFRRQGAIQIKGTLVTVPDPAKLEALLP
ncbi:MAG: Crp/Fnr family transcriptional regulator [Terriglobia bacterium]